MTTILALFRNETFHLCYSIAGAALLLFPMLGLSRWYHASMRRTAGGRAAGEKQKAIGPYARELGAGLRLGRDLTRGRYGGEARSIYKRALLFTAIWIAVVAVWWGLLIWADEMNKVPAG